MCVYNPLVPLFTVLQYECYTVHFYNCCSSKSLSFSLIETHFSLPWMSTLFFFHLYFLHAAYSCMTISLGPMIQVLSCLLHSTQNTYTSSIRPQASLYCRYSVQHSVCEYGGQVWRIWSSCFFTLSVFAHSSQTMNSVIFFIFLHLFMFK